MLGSYCTLSTEVDGFNRSVFHLFVQLLRPVALASIFIFIDSEVLQLTASLLLQKLYSSISYNVIDMCTFIALYYIQATLVVDSAPYVRNGAGWAYIFIVWLTVVITQGKHNIAYAKSNCLRVKRQFRLRRERRIAQQKMEDLIEQHEVEAYKSLAERNRKVEDRQPQDLTASGISKQRRVKAKRIRKINQLLVRDEQQPIFFV